MSMVRYCNFTETCYTQLLLENTRFSFQESKVSIKEF